MTHKHVRTIGSALACLFLLSSASFGQFDSGQIAGFVHDDASGTPYGSASVVGLLLWYDGTIMMSRTQITLEDEMQRRARRRASDLGVSLAEYFRRLVARDLARPETGTDVHRIFDLGNSGGSDIARDKDAMIAEAVDSSRRKRR